MANNGLLARLRSSYPALTESDLRYIALAYLRLDNSDISILLQMQERTLWNRRQRIKNHLGDPTMNLDEWIAGLGLEMDKPQATGRNKGPAVVTLLLAVLLIGPLFAAHPAVMPAEGTATPADTTAVESKMPQDTVTTVPDSLSEPAQRNRVRHPSPVPVHSVPGSNHLVQL